MVTGGCGDGDVDGTGIKVEEVLVEKRSIMLWRDEIINIFFYFLIIDGFN